MQAGDLDTEAESVGEKNKLLKIKTMFLAYF